jgi:hypothetical protein
MARLRFDCQPTAGLKVLGDKLGVFLAPVRFILVCDVATGTDERCRNKQLVSGSLKLVAVSKARNYLILQL